MVPVSQSILADSFPPAKRGQAFALFGVAVVVAPVVGPTLGGWLADNLSWRWCFLINGPVGLATIALIAILLPADKPGQARSAGFDFIGFLLVATFLGALEIVLDRGLEDDWFGSNFILTFTFICAIAFVLMIPWEMSRRDPMIDVRMVGSRQFGACFLVMGATGAILYATTQFLPLLVQTDFGYTATWAGLVLSPGGLVTLVMMFAVGNLSGRIQPKYLIMTGAIFAAISMYQLTNVYADLDFWFLARTRMALGIGLPLTFIPIITASYDGIPANRVDMGRPSSMRRATLAARSASRSPPTCSSTVSSSIKAGSSSTQFPRASSIRTRCNGRRNIFSRRAVCFPRRSSAYSTGW